MKTNFKVGDWVFCEFKLQQVAEMRGPNVTGVEDGFFHHGSSSLNDRCFPLGKRVKVISDSFASWSDRIHREGLRNLNFPDIHRWLTEKWADLCEHEKDDDYVRKGIKELDEWGQALLQRCQDLSHENCGGIRLFR